MEDECFRKQRPYSSYDVDTRARQKRVLKISRAMLQNGCGLDSFSKSVEK